MYNDIGYHYGQWGLWDPRTDMTTLFLREINAAEKDLSINKFKNWVFFHEMAHRSLYHHKAVVDPASLTVMATTRFSRIPVNVKLSPPEEMLKQNLIRTYLIMKNTDPLLDAFFAMKMYNSKRNFRLGEEEFLDLLLSNLKDKVSREIFYQLLWLYKESSKHGDGFVLPLYVMRHSLSIGLCPLLTTSKKEQLAFPSDIFSALYNTIHSFSGKNDNKIHDLVRMIQKFSHSKVSSAEKIVVQLNEYVHKQFPDIKLEVDNNKREINLFKNSLDILSDILGRSFRKKGERELLEQSTIVRIVDGNDVSFRFQPRIRKTRLVTASVNWAHTDALDSMFTGNKVNCVLCYYDLPLCKEIPEIHNGIDNLQDHFKPVFDYWNKLIN